MVGHSSAAFQSLIDLPDKDIPVCSSTSSTSRTNSMQMVYSTLLQSSDFLMQAAQVLFESHKFTEPDFINFSFIYCSNFDLMERFARWLFLWLRNVTEIDDYCTYPYSEENNIVMYFVKIANSACVGKCRFSFRNSGTLVTFLSR